MVTQQVSLSINTGMKQLLIHLREKPLQERQQALFRISWQRYVSQDCQLLSSYAGISEGKGSCTLTNTTIEVYAFHMIIQMYSHNRC